MNLTPQQYEKNFAGYIIVDCVVRSNDIFYFSLSEDDSDAGLANEDNSNETRRKNRIVSFIRKESILQENRWGHSEFHKSDNYKICVARLPKEQLVGVDEDGQVYVVGSGSNETEQRLGDWVDGGILRGGVTRSRMIDGYAYIAGGGRTVSVRKDRNTWVPLMNGLPYSDATDWDIAGFEDIDGFNSNDIYAVGGEADVWHFDGVSWSQINFPSNIDLHSVCCAGDGDVYISGHQGTTFRGRGQKWKQIHKGDLTLPFADMVWHDNKVWCTSDYGIWKIKEGKLKAVEIDDDIKICSGHLSAHDNILLLGGHSGAAFKEKGIWHKLF